MLGLNILTIFNTSSFFSLTPYTFHCNILMFSAAILTSCVLLFICCVCFWALNGTYFLASFVFYSSISITTLNVAYVSPSMFLPYSPWMFQIFSYITSALQLSPGLHSLVPSSSLDISTSCAMLIVVVYSSPVFSFIHTTSMFDS